LRRCKRHSRVQLASCKTLGIRRYSAARPSAPSGLPHWPKTGQTTETSTVGRRTDRMADDDAAPAEPEPELPFHERPQDLRQKGNDYEAYLKSTLGPQVVDLLTRLEEAVEFVPDGTIRRPADPRAWLATDLARQTYEAENSVLRDEVEELRAEAARLREIEEERRRANAPPPEPGSDEEEDEEESD
jgi:hypothetical protein